LLSFYPKVTISPKHMLVEGRPSTTMWEVKNEGSIPLTAPNLACRWVSPQFSFAGGGRIGAMSAVRGPDDLKDPALLMPGEAYTIDCGGKFAADYIVVDVVVTYSPIYLPTRMSHVVRFETSTTCAKGGDTGPQWIQRPAPQSSASSWQDIRAR
jgi:hypothetical protein